MTSRHTRTLAFSRRSLLILAGSIAAVLPAKAATRTWSGAASDGLWSDATNWGGTAPTTGDTALFNIAGSSISLGGSAQSLTSILFDTSTGSYTFTSGGAGGQFALGSGGSITLASTATGTSLIETFNAPITLGGNYSFTNSRADTGSALVFNGNISNSATSTLTLNGTGTGTGNAINGNISNGTGTQSVTVSSSGAWTLAGANSYSGTTTLNSGTLVLAGTNSSSGATTLSGGTLQLDNAANGGLASGTLTIANSSIQSLIANAAISNNVVINGTTSLSGTNSITINGSFTNTGGNRTLTNSLTGGATFTLAGNLYLSDSSATGRIFTLTGSGSALISGVVANFNGTGAAGTLTLSSTGTTTLTGANTYSGGTNISAGTASVATIGNVESTGANLGGAGVVSIGSTTTNAKLVYTGVGETTDRVINLGGTTGGATIDQSGSGLLNFTSNFTATGVGSKTLTLQGSTAGVGEISGIIADSSGTGLTSLTKTGSGTWILTGANTYSGNTSIGLGALTVTSASGLGNSALSNAIALSGTGRLNLLNDGAGSNGTIIYTGSGSATGYNVTVSNSPSINVGNNVSNNTGNTIQLGTLALANSTFTITNSAGYGLSFSGAATSSGSSTLVNNMADGTTTLASYTETDAAGRSLTFGGTSASAITSVGAIGQNAANALSVNQSGAGLAILTGANTYTGITTVNAGTLLLDMSAGGSINGSTGTNLTLGGGNFQVKSAAAGSAQTMGNFTLTTNTNNVVTLDPNNGAGLTLTLGNAWTRNAGSSLLINYSSANTGASSVVTAGATTGATLTNGIYGWALVEDSSGVVGFATRAAGTNSAITRYDDTTGSTLVVNSNSTTTNFTTLASVYTGGNGGTLTWTNGGGLGSRGVNSLTIDTTNNFGTIDMGAATNVLTLTSLGLLFKGSNNETLTGGKLGTSGSEVIIHQTGTGVLTVNSPISAAAGSLTKDGVGTLALSGASVYTNATNVNAGALLVNGSLTGTSAVNVENGASLGGNGAITTNNGNVTLAEGAQLSPGSGTAPGTLTLTLGTGALDLSAVGAANAGSLLFALGTTSDELSLSTGVLKIGAGTLGFNDFTFSDSGGLTGGIYTLFAAPGGITGSLDTTNLTGTLGNGLTATLSLDTVNNDVNLIVVPEPSSVISIFGGLGLLLGLQRFRRRSRA